MSTEHLNLTLAVVQTLTFLALIIYVKKTWDMASATHKAAEISQKSLEEMKESRDQEMSPCVVPYFDVPYGQSRVYFTVKNVGRGVANDVRLRFTPELRNSFGNDVSNLPLITDGISSLPPGQEIRVLFDDFASYMNDPALPAGYKVEVVCHGGLLPDERCVEYRLDLSMFLGVNVEDNGTSIDPTKEIAASLKSIADSLQHRVDVQS